MKHNKNHNHGTSAGPQLMPVHFQFTHPLATTVCVAGTFNDWNPTAKAMRNLGAGPWSKDSSLTPGTYEYCLVVDGQWMADPLVRESVPNPYGGRNSVLTVAGSPTEAHLAAALNLPLKSAT